MKPDMQVQLETQIYRSVGLVKDLVVLAHKVFQERAEKVIIGKPDKTEFQLVASKKERSFCSLLYGKPKGDLTSHIVSVFHELTKTNCVQI